MTLLIKNILYASIFSFAFIWIVAYFLDDSLHVYEYNKELEMYVLSPGTLKFRSEGNAKTQIGHYGINAIPDITKVKKGKIAICGDSFSEAWQVDDDKKMSQQR